MVDEQLFVASGECFLEKGAALGVWSEDKQLQQRNHFIDREINSHKEMLVLKCLGCYG